MRTGPGRRGQRILDGNKAPTPATLENVCAFDQHRSHDAPTRRRCCGIGPIRQAEFDEYAQKPVPGAVVCPTSRPTSDILWLTIAPIHPSPCAPGAKDTQHGVLRLADSHHPTLFYFSSPAGLPAVCVPTARPPTRLLLEDPSRFRGPNEARRMELRSHRGWDPSGKIAAGYASRLQLYPQII